MKWPGLARLTVAAMLAAWWALAAFADRSALALAPTPPRLNAGAAILVDAPTGQILYGLNPNQERPIASATKLMTALLSIERVPLGTILADPTYYPAPVDSQIGLTPGERMSVHDLLIALLLPSADDAAQDLAYNVGGGSVPHFIDLMNARAAELHLRRTHYSTPIGLDTPGNYSSASDLALLAAYLLTHDPFFAHVVALPSAVLLTGADHRTVRNRNTLVGRVPWITGVKTGHTSGAGYVLVGSGKRDGSSLLSVVLGTPSEAARNADTLALLDYGFANFRQYRPVVADAVLARPTVRDRPGVRVDLVAGATVTRILPRNGSLTTRIDAPHELVGPLKRHAIVGSVLVLQDGRPITRVPLLLARKLPAVSLLARAARVIGRPSTLVILLALVGAGLLASRRRWRARHEHPDAEPA